MSESGDRLRLTALVSEVADRCRNQPNLDDYLLWSTGALGPWLDVLVSSVGREHGWAARSEVPFVTRCPAPGSPSNLAWADGAVVWTDGFAALVGVTSIPVRAALGPTIERVPENLVTLLGADWPPTRVQARDPNADPGWWAALDGIERPWALQLGLVHGTRERMNECSPPVRAGIKRGLISLRRYSPVAQSRWVEQATDAFDEPLTSLPIESANAAAVLLAWARPIDAAS